MIKSSLVKKINRYTDYLVYLQIAPSEVITFTPEWLANQADVKKSIVEEDLLALDPTVTDGNYSREKVIDALEESLDYRSAHHAVIVGAGRLGRALMEYEGFEAKGLHISAAFDSNPYAVDPSHKIYSVNKLKEFCQDNDIKIGIITAPKQYAQEIADTLVDAGVVGIWCFAPVRLKVPANVHVQYENMSVSLSTLCSFINGYHEE